MPNDVKLTRPPFGPFPSNYSASLDKNEAIWLIAKTIFALSVSLSSPALFLYYFYPKIRLQIDRIVISCAQDSYMKSFFVLTLYNRTSTFSGLF